MSTEKVEINEAVAQKSTEEQVKELKEQGIDVNTSQSEDGTTIIATEPDTQAQNIENQRPEWLPEKFKNAEDLAKAYSELEKQFSSKKDEPVKEEASEDLAIPKEEPKSPEGISLDKYSEEYAEKGGLSEKSYEDLAKQGLPKDLVDGYIAGQEAIANTEVQAVHNLVGGTDNYNKVIEYAKGNLNEAEQNAFNETLETGSIEQVKFAVQGIASRAGVNAEQPQTMINGDSIETNSDIFESSAQVIDDMNDPRYAKDPAFRKLVEEKIARSTAI